MGKCINPVMVQDSSSARPMDKFSRMRAGQKGFPTATQNDCETPPTERSYSLPSCFSRGYETAEKFPRRSHSQGRLGDEESREQGIALPRDYRGKTIFQKPGMGFSNSRGTMAPSRVT